MNLLQHQLNEDHRVFSISHIILTMAASAVWSIFDCGGARGNNFNHTAALLAANTPLPTIDTTVSELTGPCVSDYVFQSSAFTLDHRH